MSAATSSRNVRESFAIPAFPKPLRPVIPMENN
jgi:hypothetical protein